MRNPFRRRNWKQTEATVFTCGIQNEYTPGAGGGYVDSEYLIVFSYEIGGQWYSGEYTTNTSVPEKSTFPLRYDADDPAYNQYSLDDALNTLPFKIAGYAAVVAVFVLYEWLRGRGHH